MKTNKNYQKMKIDIKLNIYIHPRKQEQQASQNTP